jgi:hypothetical protein
MTNKDIDDILKSSTHEADPALLAGIAASISARLAPVRPLPPAWALTAAVAVICGIVPTVAAFFLGFQGIERLGMDRIRWIFPALVLFTIFAASLTVAEMIPGSRRIVNAGTLLAASSLAVLAVFALLFHDFDMSRFIPQGLVCLGVGMLVAIPTGLANWLALRRGFAVNATSAGLAAGTLAGLAGVIALELHCPNFRAMHVMVWHTAVILVGAFTGAMLGSLIARK